MSWSGAISVYANPFGEFSNAYEQAKKDSLDAVFKKIQLADQLQRLALAHERNGRDAEAHKLRMQRARLTGAEEDLHKQQNAEIEQLQRELAVKSLRRNIQDLDAVDSHHVDTPAAHADPRFSIAPKTSVERPDHLPGPRLDHLPGPRMDTAPEPKSSNPRRLSIPSLGKQSALEPNPFDIETTDVASVDDFSQPKFNSAPQDDANDFGSDYDDALA